MEMEISAVVDAELLVFRAASLLRCLKRVKVVNVKLSKCFFQALSSCETLQTLELNSCNLVTSISLDSSSLENIRLMHLSKCTDLNLQSPNLSKIEVYKCSALKHVSITSDVLERLVLWKQEVLADLSLKCKTLVEVDLTGCKLLTTAISKVFSGGGGCPMLTRLVLDNCEENGQQMMENTDELDYMAAHHFSVFIGNLLFYLVLELDMPGRLRKVWDDYTL